MGRGISIQSENLKVLNLHNTTRLHFDGRDSCSVRLVQKHGLRVRAVLKLDNYKWRNVTLQLASKWLT